MAWGRVRGVGVRVGVPDSDVNSKKAHAKTIGSYWHLQHFVVFCG